MKLEVPICNLSSLWYPAGFWDFRARTTRSHVALRARVTQAPKVVESCSKAQKT